MQRVAPLFRLRKKVAELPEDSEDLERLRAELVLRESIFKPLVVEYDQIEAASKVAGVDPKLVTKALEITARIPFQRVYERYEKKYYGSPNLREQRKARKIATRETYALLKEGKTISNRYDDLHHRFWLLAFDGSMDAKDFDRAQEALDVYSKSYGQSPAGKREAGKMRTRLEKARAAKG